MHVHLRLQPTPGLPPAGDTGPHDAAVVAGAARHHAVVCHRPHVMVSAPPPKSECACSARRLAAEARWRQTYLAIVLASSSNMTRARFAAVSLGGGSRPDVGLVTACLGLDCHEFSSAPSHANAWSTRFLPGQMFPARAQTSTAGTGSIRLAGWCPDTVCYQPPGHCQSCTRNAHPTATNPRPTDDRLRTRRTHTT